MQRHMLYEQTMIDSYLQIKIIIRSTSMSRIGVPCLKTDVYHTLSCDVFE